MFKHVLCRRKFHFQRHDKPLYAIDLTPLRALDVDLAKSNIDSSRASKGLIVLDVRIRHSGGCPKYD